MPKEQTYTLFNKGYFVLLNELGRAFSERSIDHLLVGGGAIQAYSLFFLTNDGKLSLEDAVKPSEVIGQLIRSTDDYDFITKDASDWDVREAINSLNEVTVEQDDPPNLFAIKIGRDGAVRQMYNVEELSHSNNGREVQDSYDIWSTVAYIPKSLKVELPEGFYESRFEEDNVREFSITYDGLELKVRVPRPELLLAPKIARGRPKDLMDIYNLIEIMADRGEQFDFSKITDVLLTDSLRYKYKAKVNRFLERSQEYGLALNINS